MRAGRLTPARTMSEAKVWRNRCGLASFDAGGPAMIAKQGAQTRRCHACAASAPFQRNEQSGGATDRAVPAADSDPAVAWLPEPAAGSGSCCLCRARGSAPSESSRSSRFRSSTSCERSPCSSIRPTMAKSREVRKLDQNRATSSTDNGTMVRLGVFTRNRLKRESRPAEAHGRYAASSV